MSDKRDNSQANYLICYSRSCLLLFSLPGYNCGWSLVLFKHFYWMMTKSQGAQVLVTALFKRGISCVKSNTEVNWKQSKLTVMDDESKSLR